MKHTQEQIREALMRLSMCARKECEMCKYKDRPKAELPSDDCKERSTKNMHILADVCLSDEHYTEKVCTGKRCPMQVGYDVKNCKDKDCFYRTETEKGGVSDA